MKIKIKRIMKKIKLYLQMKRAVKMILKSRNNQKINKLNLNNKLKNKKQSKIRIKRNIIKIKSKLKIKKKMKTII